MIHGPVFIMESKESALLWDAVRDPDTPPLVV
jgi:hypothetical protein